MISKITVKDGEGNITAQTVFADGSREEKDEDEKSDNEKYYDKEISPVLADLAKKCQKNGMSLATMVEYDNGDTGNTIYTQKVKDMSVKMIMAVTGIKCNGNIDSFLMAMIQYFKRENIDTKGSIYLHAIEEYFNRFKE